MIFQQQAPSGPYIDYDGLPVLSAAESERELVHPYAQMTSGQYITPGGGRLLILTVGMHHEITLDHTGCPAQNHKAKSNAFMRLALAAEGHCLQAGCQHSASYQGGAFRRFQVLTEGIDLTTFVRSLLAIELGDFTPTGILEEHSNRIAGPIQRAASASYPI